MRETGWEVKILQISPGKMEKSIRHSAPTAQPSEKSSKVNQVDIEK